MELRIVILCKLFSAAAYLFLLSPLFLLFCARLTRQLLVGGH